MQKISLLPLQESGDRLVNACQPEPFSFLLSLLPQGVHPEFYNCISYAGKHLCFHRWHVSLPRPALEAADWLAQKDPVAKERL